MKRQSDRDKLIEQLKKTPIVQVACQKVGVARPTYYHWRKHDDEFTKACDEAISEGEALYNDIAESQLVAAIREGNMTGIIFWLKHRHPAYATRLEIEASHKLDDNLTPEQEAVLDKALRLAGLPKLETPKEGSDDSE